MLQGSDPQDSRGAPGLAPGPRRFLGSVLDAAGEGARGSRGGTAERLPASVRDWAQPRRCACFAGGLRHRQKLHVARSDDSLHFRIPTSRQSSVRAQAQQQGEAPLPHRQRWRSRDGSASILRHLQARRL